MENLRGSVREYFFCIGIFDVDFVGIERWTIEAPIFQVFMDGSSHRQRFLSTRGYVHHTQGRSSGAPALLCDSPVRFLAAKPGCTLRSR
jgi:hypothetical protein